MKIIGITGGIGSGKSTVTGFLQDRGYPVVDADLIARKIVEPGSTTLVRLEARFGKGILKENGELDRKKLADLAFSSAANKVDLDKITHGAIFDEIHRQIETLRVQRNPRLVFVDAALMIETGLYKKMDEVWLVTAKETLRVKRVATRDQLDDAQVKQRIRMQMSDQQKAPHALHLIDNSGTKDELYQKLEKIMRDYETV
jgi:dephospho-CoA kinase